MDEIQKQNIINNIRKSYEARIKKDPSNTARHLVDYQEAMYKASQL